MKQLITTARIRSILAGICTEKSAAEALRAHRVKYTFTTEGGALHIRIPARSGYIRIVKTCSRSAPLAVYGPGPAGLPYLFPRPPRND